MRNNGNFKLLHHYRNGTTYGNWAALCSMFLFLSYSLYFGLRLFTDYDLMRYYPIGIDFAVFWSAGKLALVGAADQAYSVDAINPILRVITDYTPDSVTLPWFYPPVTFFFFLPFAILPYKIAVCLWQSLGVSVYFCGLSKYSKNRFNLIFMLGFPGFWMNFSWGNHAYIITALIALGYYHINKKPLVTGCMFGLLCYKPHFAAICILTLFIMHKWNATFSAFCTILSLIMLTILCFPLEVWQAYFASMSQAVDYLLISGWGNYPEIHVTVYTFAKLLGAGSNTAFLIQGTAAATAFIVLGIIRNYAGGNHLQVAAVVLVIFLTTPYALQYDLALVGLPLVIYYEDVLLHGWLFQYEKLILALCWLLPLYNWPIALRYSIQLAPIVVFAFLIGLAIRSRKLNKRHPLLCSNE